MGLIRRAADQAGCEIESLRAQNGSLKAAGRKAADDATSALDLISRVRFALGDNGTRMQAEFLDYCRDLASPRPRPISEWHDDIGTVLWWVFPVVEPPYVGTPGDDDWPGYHTHFTPIVVPSLIHL